MADGRRARQLAERSDRAGRVELITNLVNLQRQLSAISANIQRAKLAAAEHGVHLGDDNEEALQWARTNILDGSDKLHAVAARMVGELRREIV
jgi:hypothetical protein